MRKIKYGLIKKCPQCNSEFETKRMFLTYCSTPCKNPINRPGHLPWNKGIKLTDEQRAKQNTEGLKKGRGWNKGKPNEIDRSKVRYFTYRTIKIMKESGDWVPKFGKYKDSWQVDHIIPHKQGFELGIDPSILGGKNNIQFIKGEENRKKWDSYQPSDVVDYIIGGKYGLR